MLANKIYFLKTDTRAIKLLNFMQLFNTIILSAL